MEREPVRDINVDDAVHSWRTPELEDSRQFESYLATNGLVRHSLGARLMSRSPAVDRPGWAKSFESKYRHTGRWYDAVGPYRFNAQQLEALPFEISAQQHFFKMGMFAGLTYALGATDFHTENVIATANGPVPVDAETILGAGVDDQEKSDAFSAARGFLNDSAIGTGVLPVGVQISGSDDFEVSALAGGMTPSSASHQAIVNLGDDDINRD